MVSSDQPGGSHGSKDAYIESLLQQLHEKEKELLEKDSIISETRQELLELKKKDQLPSPSSQEDGSIDVAEAVKEEETGNEGTEEGLFNPEEEVEETAEKEKQNNVGESISTSLRRRAGGLGLSLGGSVVAHVTWSDFLEASKKLHAKNKQLVSKPTWYSPPAQQIRWGADQHLPHVNWMDLFFDLFYVAAVYNLGVSRVLELTGLEGKPEYLRLVIYFLGSLGPLWICWQCHTYYQARYATNDIFHRVVKMFQYLCIGFAIANVAPLDTNDLFETDAVMYFFVGILAEFIISIGLMLELYFRATGDRDCIKAHTLFDFKFRFGPILAVYIAAFVIAVVNHFAAKAEGGEGEGNGATSGVSELGTENATTNDSQPEAALLRLLSASKGSDSPQDTRAVWDGIDIPLTLTAIVYILTLILRIPRIYWVDTRRDIRSWFVPFNIGYVIHRYGEFTMLVIGEGVLSLLISPTVEGKSYLDEYYKVVILGILTMILIQVVHYDTVPSDASHHALYGSIFRSNCYVILFNVLTISLIGLGVSFKGFLHGIHQEFDEQNEMDFTTASKTFSAFLFLVVFFLEMINVTHIGGFKEAYERRFVVKEGERKPHWPVILVTLIKVGVLLFSATLSQWNHEPGTLAGCGCAAIFVVAITRQLNKYFIEEAGNAGDN